MSYNLLRVLAHHWPEADEWKQASEQRTASGTAEHPSFHLDRDWIRAATEPILDTLTRVEREFYERCDGRQVPARPSAGSLDIPESSASRVRAEMRRALAASLSEHLDWNRDPLVDKCPHVSCVAAAERERFNLRMMPITMMNVGVTIARNVRDWIGIKPDGFVAHLLRP